METNEHRNAGNKIRIMTLGNPYLEGSEGLSESDNNNLHVRMMRLVNGIPVPLEFALEAGDIVALAGDYYTKEGWGLDLQLPPLTGHVKKDNKALFNLPVSPKETDVYLQAYGDLASPTLREADIQQIYAIEERTYIPFFPALNNIFQQLVYAFRVNGYNKKLTLNEAHFAPWSTRAYMVGHTEALHSTELAYAFKLLAAEGDLSEIEPGILSEARRVAEAIGQNPTAYGYNDSLLDNKTLYNELYYRYHALAVGQDLFTMHFYSDHFAGGHLSRIGLLRQIMPAQFGNWGSILINNMHNEDNTFGLNVLNPFQPKGYKHYGADTVFGVNPSQDQAYGDGTYFERSNDEDSNQLINGMDNSLGDITRRLLGGKKPQPSQYGGLAFLPEVNYKESQPQPLLIHGLDGRVYYRADISRVDVLSAEQYTLTRQDPANHGYKELGYFSAIWLVAKLRLLSFIYSPKLEQPTPKNTAVVTSPLQEEAARSVMDHLITTTVNPVASSPEPVEEQTSVGAWRENLPLSSGLLRTCRFMPQPGISALNTQQPSPEVVLGL
ncbi:TPA: hypothetical protein ACPSKB_001536 [Legionella feeleii]